MLKLSFLCAFSAVVIGIVLFAMAHPAIADDLKASGYRSPAVVLVTMEPLAPLPQAASLATAPPSKVLFKGNTEMAMRHALPPKFIVGKAVTNTAGEAIGIISKIDGEQIVLAVGGDLGVPAHYTTLNWNHFSTRGKGADIKLLTTLSKAQLVSLPNYTRLD